MTNFMEDFKGVKSKTSESDIGLEERADLMKVGTRIMSKFMSSK